jgi:flagellar protein FliL
MASDAAPAAAAPKPAKSGFGIGILLAAVLLSTAGAGGAAWFVMGRAKASESAPAGEQAEGAEAEAALPAPASYLPLEPAFTVNLETPDETRYLQTEVQLMGRDAAALETVKLHVPRIRNVLLLLFGQQKPADLVTREGKEKLQQTALAEVQKVLKAETGKPVIEAVYFTSFVMQ